jgi:hypothetical protein
MKEEGGWVEEGAGLRGQERRGDGMRFCAANGYLYRR